MHAWHNVTALSVGQSIMQLRKLVLLFQENVVRCIPLRLFQELLNLQEVDIPAET